MTQNKARRRWFVEYIIAARRTFGCADPATKGDYFATGAWLYHLKWAGFEGKNSTTWEPVENLHECKRLLTSFWENVGEGTFETTFEGYEVWASQDWIDRERYHFQTETTAKEVTEQNKNPAKQNVGNSKTRKRSNPSVSSKSRKRYDTRRETREVEDEENGSSASSSRRKIPSHAPPPNDTDSETPDADPSTEGSVTPACDGDTPPTPPQTPDPQKRRRSARVPTPRIMYRELQDIKSASKMSTKQRLGKHPIAPTIRRYVSPCPTREPVSATSADDEMGTGDNSDMQPAQVPESDDSAAIPPNVIEKTTDVEMFDPTALEDPEQVEGMYAPGEDPFASMRTETSDQWNSDDPRPGFDVDSAANEFLNCLVE